MPDHTPTEHQQPRHPKISPKAQSVIVVVLSVIAIFNLTWLGLRGLVAYRMKTQYIQTTGVVVDVALQKPENQTAPEQHYPVVEFQTQEGKSVVFKAKVGTPEPKYQTGQSVVILYNKERPYIALLDTTQN